MDSNFTVGEMKLVTSAFLALIILNYLFLFSGIFDSAITNEPPKLNVSGQEFIQAGSFPNPPSKPSQGYISNLDGAFDGYSSAVKLGNDTTLNLAAYNQSYATVELRDTAGGGVIDSAEFTDSNQTDTLTGNGFTIDLKTTDYGTRSGGSLPGATVEYRISDQPENTGWVDRLPGIGFLISGGDQLAQTALWIGSIFIWPVLVFAEIVVNVVYYLGALIVFGVAFVNYLITGWIDIAKLLNQGHIIFSLLVIGAQIPLYLILFNAVMKVLKVLPTT